MRNLLTLVRLLSGLLLLTLAAIIAYWFMQLLAPRPAIAPSGNLGEAAASRSLTAAGQAFGRPGAPVAVAATPTNIQVVGVAESGKNGVAILAVDGKPAAAFAVGSKVDDSTRLVSALDGVVVLEQNGRRLEIAAPERPSLAVLTSGVGKPRDPGQATTTPSSAPAPGRPGGFNLPPRAAPPGYTPPPPQYTPPPVATPQPAAPPMQPIPQPQSPAQPQPQGQGADAQAMPPPNPDATQPAYPPQYTPPQFTPPEYNPQTGQSTSGIITPAVPVPTQSAGNPSLAQPQ